MKIIAWFAVKPDTARHVCRSSSPVVPPGHSCIYVIIVNQGFRRQLPHYIV